MSSEATSAKVKFLCSHGGKILPRPSDGQLKYVGGETRVICVPRITTFSEVMEKISSMFEGEFVLKYQIWSEDLDALVSVKSDEDVHHMLDEKEHLERGGASKLRTFLFSTKSTQCEPGVESWEQRYMDAVNGVVRPNNIRPSSSNRVKSISGSASECTSPRSPSPQTQYKTPIYQGGMSRINRVRSSPSLISIADQNPQPSSNGNNFPNHRPYYYQTHHHQLGRHQLGKHHDNHFAKASQQSFAAYHSSQVCQGCSRCGGHHHHNNNNNRVWAHAHLGKPPAAYGDGSVRPTNVSPSRRGVIWE